MFSQVLLIFRYIDTRIISECLNGTNRISNMNNDPTKSIDASCLQDFHHLKVKIILGGIEFAKP